MGARGVVRLVSHAGDTQGALPLARAVNAPRWLCLDAPGSSGVTFAGVAKRLAHVVDLAAVVLSDASSEPLEQHVDALLSRLSREQAPVVLAGHAYGALVALECARRHPERVHRLVLVEPLALQLLRREEQAEAQQLRAMLWRLEELVGRGQHLEAARLFANQLDETAWARLPETARSRAAEAAPGLVRALVEASLLPVSLADYGHLDVPTVLVRGAKSPWVTRWLTGQLSRVLPRVTLFDIANAGHLSPLAHPDELAFILRRSVLEPAAGFGL